MDRGLLFWLIFVIWVVVYLVFKWPVSRASASDIVLAILLALLGWSVFGAVVR